MKASPALGLIFLLVLGTVSNAGTDVVPFEAMRSLQALQDRIATGDEVAQAAHAKAIMRTARAFTAAKPEIWRDKRNARALVVYLFSGGDASIMEDAIPPSVIAPEIMPLYQGAIAYGRGDDVTARARLMPIDPKTVPNGLGGHLALIQATLLATDDAPKAIALLDVARLLEPGTLVEEAALRKEMSLIGSSGDLDKFVLTSAPLPRRLSEIGLCGKLPSARRQVGHAVGRWRYGGSRPKTRTSDDGSRSGGAAASLSRDRARVSLVWSFDDGGACRHGGGASSRKRGPRRGSRDGLCGGGDDCRVEIRRRSRGSVRRHA